MRNVLLVFLVLALAPSTAMSGSLADAAKKEKERREKNKEAGVTAVRTITQDDVKTNDSPSEAGGSYTGGSAESGSAVDASAAPAPADSLCCGEAPGGSSRSGSSEEESAWRSRARYARDRVERARKKLADTPSRIMRHKSYGGGGFTMYDNPSYKPAQEELRSAEKALSDLEEDARQRRVPPGWLR
jgi:hypothetical protein